MTFRGTTYRFPVSIWIPHAYPREPPLVYVTPTEAMVVRPGQHVDPQGQVYHPYLVGWADFWDVRWHTPGHNKGNYTWKWLLTKVLSRNLIYSTSWP